MAEEQVMTSLIEYERPMIGMVPDSQNLSPDELFEQLQERIHKYRKDTDLSVIEKAYHVAREAHEGQLRRSGEPYIIHPLCVAIILAELEMDKETIAAGILHDVIEDTALTEEQMKAEFGEEITLLVNGVTKLTQLSYSADKIELQAENLRKMFLAMAKDIRVIIIKLADRLHNMRTMEYQTPEKQISKSRETLDIYAPIAQRLGISKIKVELDDLSLRYIYPDVYNELNEKIALKKEERDAFVAQIREEVGHHIAEAGIKATIDGRVKHFFSIYKKMFNQHKTLDQIYDLFAIRILVDDVKDCYAALGVIHEMYKPIPGRFKDYIAMPKANMYQSLHTTLISNSGTPFEIQIRTWEMHRTAEYGIAAHWKYKENQDGKVTSKAEGEKMQWLREVLEWQKDLSDNKEFLSALKNDFNLFSDNVFCFTPGGDVKNLPAGSTPIDFAYSIHSAVGNKMVGARVNGKLVPIDYVIQNGDQIEIMTSQNTKGPSRDWLKIVKSSQAKNKILHWFRDELKEDNIQRGKDMLAAYCKAKGLNITDYTKPEFVEPCLKKYGFGDWDSICAAVGHGGLKEGQIINRLIEEYDRKQEKNITDEQIVDAVAGVTLDKTSRGGKKGGIVVQGVDDVSVHFAKCCSPVPGDEIVGFVTRGRGITLHRTDCVNVLSLPADERDRLIEAEWNVPVTQATAENYYTEIKLFANNRTGIIVDISRILTENKIEIMLLNARASKQGTATINVGFEVSSVNEMNSIIGKLRSIEGVLDIKRISG